MEEEEVRGESTNGPPGSTPPSIGRRQLLQALGVAAGALAATTFLPNGWTEPAIAADPKPTDTPKPKDKYTSTPTSTSTSTPTSTPTPTATPTATATPVPTGNPLRIDNLSISSADASFSYSCPGLDINDDNTYMHAKLSPYGEEQEGSLRYLSGRPNPLASPTPLYLRRQASSPSEGIISFRWWPLAVYGTSGVQDPYFPHPNCSIGNATPGVLTVWLYTRSNTLASNSSIYVCVR